MFPLSFRNSTAPLTFDQVFVDWWRNLFFLPKDLTADLTHLTTLHCKIARSTLTGASYSTWMLGMKMATALVRRQTICPPLYTKLKIKPFESARVLMMIVRMALFTAKTKNQCRILRYLNQSHKRQLYTAERTVESNSRAASYFVLDKFKMEWFLFCCSNVQPQNTAIKLRNKILIDVEI